VKEIEKEMVSHIFGSVKVTRARTDLTQYAKALTHDTRSTNATPHSLYSAIPLYYSRIVVSITPGYLPELSHLS
jgi:hypothetical protein